MYLWFSQDQEYSTFSNGVGQNHRPRQQQTEARVKMVELQREIARAALRADSCRVWPRWPSITSTPPELRHGSSVGARNSRIRPDLGSRARCVRTSRIGLFAVTMALACSSRVMGRDPGTVCCWWAESAARLLEQHCVLRSVDQVYLVVSKFICSAGTAAVQWLAAPNICIGCGKSSEHLWLSAHLTCARRSGSNPLRCHKSSRSQQGHGSVMFDATAVNEWVKVRYICIYMAVSCMYALHYSSDLWQLHC